VKRVSIPSSGKPGKQRKEQQKKRWFKKLQKASVLKRRHGLHRNRCANDPDTKGFAE
jgi:hypothetical protein